MIKRPANWRPLSPRKLWIKFSLKRPSPREFYRAIRFGYLFATAQSSVNWHLLPLRITVRLSYTSDSHPQLRNFSFASRSSLALLSISCAIYNLNNDAPLPLLPPSLRLLLVYVIDSAPRDIVAVSFFAERQTGMYIYRLYRVCAWLHL